MAKIVKRFFDAIVSVNHPSFMKKQYALGLMTQDLWREDDHQLHKEAVQLLPPDIKAERQFRISRAAQLDMVHRQLPENQWMTIEKDVPYLTPYIKIVKEKRCREAVVLARRCRASNLGINNPQLYQGLK